MTEFKTEADLTTAERVILQVLARHHKIPADHQQAIATTAEGCGVSIERVVALTSEVGFWGSDGFRVSQ